jgi:hypothetical protein
MNIGYWQDQIKVTMAIAIQLVDPIVK